MKAFRRHILLFTTAVILFSVSSFSSIASTEETFKLIVSHPSYRNSTLEKLRVIMDQTIEKYGPYEIVSGPEMNRARAETGINSGELHLMWGSFSPSRISKMHPIYSFVILAPPRVCLIEKGTRAKFAGIKSLSDWKRNKLTTGLGTYWSDVSIYQYNDMEIETTPKSNLLYIMLANGRYDCFNRGAGEVFGNLKSHPDLPIEIEPSLAFIFEGKYSGFLIAPNNLELRERLEYGIEQAWSNSAFEPLIGRLLAEESEKLKALNLGQRTFIKVKNPNAVDKTKVRAVNQRFMDEFLKNM